MKKRFLIFILALVMTLVFVPGIASAANTTEFAGGSGTAKDPYLISTKAQLNNVRNYRGSHFKLTRNIVFTKADFAKGGAFYNGGAGWTPINNFYGSFDGNGFVLKNLYINITSDSYFVYAGLFGYNYGTIQNLGMVGGTILVTAESYVYVGGIAGTNYGTITNCYNTGKVSATAEGSVFVGGIAGWNDKNISNCYNTGKVSATSEDFAAYAGGIAGRNEENISNCYNTGKVSARGTFAFLGGIAGVNKEDIKNSYYLDTIWGVDYGSSTGTTSCTAQQMQTKSTFAGFDFTNTWKIYTVGEYKYPVLRSVDPYKITATLSKTSYTYDGKVKTPAVTVKNGLGETLKKNVDYTVTYASGRIKLGTYKVTIKGKGNYSFTKTLTFKINPIKASNCAMKLSATSYTYDGKMKAPTVKITSPTGSTLTKGRDYTVSYASGRRNAGTYKVTVTFKGIYSGTKTQSFKIKPIKASNCAMKLSAYTYTYDGKMKTPTVTVKSPTGSTLTKGRDYTVSYASGRRNAGTYKVTVTFKGNYSGTKAQSFKINPIKASNCAMKLSAYTYTYDGKMKAPTVKITSPTGSKLTKGTSYTVSYASGRKNVGTYTVKVTMKGNYSGTRTLTFKINPPKTTVSKLTAGSKSITVGITKKTTQVTGYQIQYSTSKTFSSATTKTVSSYKTTSCALKGLSAKKTYFVRVRTYKTVNNTKYYSSWSAYKYVKTK